MSPRSRLLAPLGLALSACAPHAPRDSSALFSEEITVVAHRGASSRAPENTAAAFEAAAELGVPFELDVTFTSTGEVVVIHDDTLDRTTTGAGLVSETPLATIRGLDAGSWFDPRFAGEPVPELGNVLEAFAPRVPIDIEIKNPVDKALVVPLAQAVARLVEEAEAVDRVFVTSFNPYLLEALREANPAILRGQLYGSFKGSELSAVERFVLRNLLLNGKAVPDLLVAEHSILSRGYVRRMRRRGYRVMAWTVNEPAEWERLVDMGVQGLITDKPEEARAWVAARP